MIELLSAIWGPQFVIGVGVGGVLSGTAMVVAGLLLGAR